MDNFPLAGWRSRGYLPHVDAPGMVQHIVFSLADALPNFAADELPADPIERIVAFETALDRGDGQCLLANPACAGAVQNELLRLDHRRYRLLAWCVMPNHVHVVIEQIEDLPGTVRRWKTWTAREINRIAQRRGLLWRREYFDRFARNDHHLQTMVTYVETNPVTAGLVASAEEWLWSSVRHRLAG